MSRCDGESVCEASCTCEDSLRCANTSKRSPPGLAEVSGCRLTIQSDASVAPPPVVITAGIDRSTNICGGPALLPSCALKASTSSPRASLGVSGPVGGRSVLIVGISVSRSSNEPSAGVETADMLGTDASDVAVRRASAARVAGASDLSKARPAARLEVRNFSTRASICSSSGMSSTCSTCPLSHALALRFFTSDLGTESWCGAVVPISASIVAIVLASSSIGVRSSVDGDSCSFAPSFCCSSSAYAVASNLRSTLSLRPWNALSPDCSKPSARVPPKSEVPSTGGPAD